MRHNAYARHATTMAGLAAVIVIGIAFYQRYAEYQYLKDNFIHSAVEVIRELKVEEQKWYVTVTATLSCSSSGTLY